MQAARIARQVIAGIPYLQKEIARSISLHTGQVLVTPATYYIIFGGRCNLECPFCTIYPRVEPSLTGDEVLRIIRQAKELSGRGFNISLSGGEPTIYKPLFDCLELAHQLGVNFGFTTNGLALTKTNIQRILACDPFNINVSLESVDPKINDSLRPMENSTARTLAAIENLVAEKERIGARVSIIIKPTIMEQNYRGLPELARHFGKNSPVQIHMQPYVGKTGDRFWVQDKANLRRVLDELIALREQGYRLIGDRPQFDRFYEYLSDPPAATIRRFDLNGEKRNCDIGLRTLYVEPNGDVFFCDYLKPIGNIRQNSLSELYYGTNAAGQRKTMITCNIDCQQTCKRKVPVLSKARAFLRMG